MSHFFRVITARTALAAGMALLATGGTMAGLASAAQVPAQRPRPIDHQLCYTAAGKGFKIPKGVVLKNQLNPRGFRPKITSVAFHCNPVQKSFLGGQTFRISNPNAHLVCFKITAARQPQHLVFVANQFGQGDLNVAQPDLLCLPSWKRLAGPPRQKHPQPPGLDHFTCYPVTVQQGHFFVLKGIMVRDQFARRPVPVHVSNVPTELCVPTQKTIGRHVTRILHPAMHLLCFPVSSTPLKPKVFDQNQFGTGVVHLRHTNWLCLPTSKQLIR
jgi:hypothetical protein